jgi:hypothetical protein
MNTLRRILILSAFAALAVNLSAEDTNDTMAAVSREPATQFVPLRMVITWARSSTNSPSIIVEGYAATSNGTPIAYLSGPVPVVAFKSAVGSTSTTPQVANGVKSLARQRLRLSASSGGLK